MEARRKRHEWGSRQMIWAMTRHLNGGVTSLLAGWRLNATSEKLDARHKVDEIASEESIRVREVGLESGSGLGLRLGLCK